MLTERLQILVSREQRQRLEEQARLRGTSVAALIREAVDASLGGPSIEDRKRAVEAIGAMRGRYLSPEELEAIVDEERDAVVPTDLGR
jgi:predicted DNA-binding protein